MARVSWKCVIHPVKWCPASFARKYFHTSSGIFNNGHDDFYKKQNDWKKKSEVVIQEELSENNEDAQDFFYLRDQFIHVQNSTPQVLVIQPFRRIKNHEILKNQTTDPNLMLQESLALIRTINWKIVDAITLGLHSTKEKELFRAGKLQELQSKVSNDERISCIFISLYMLSYTQRIALQSQFNVPVVDRYSLILQIFQLHARTREAHLQIALAELPYLKHRLNTEYFFEQNNKHAKGNLGEDNFEKQNFVLRKWEQKLKKKINKIRDQRQKLRETKHRSLIPTVAIVGYTNCGKTSLIRTLTDDESIMPEDKLFATLDVTTHVGKLPRSNITCLFVDTVGFISDIPTHLIASFSATLEDALQADVVVHVRDISHPDTRNQHQQVLDTFKKLSFKLTEENSITVVNKIDKLKDVSIIKDAKDKGELPISATLNLGLNYLQNEIEQKIISLRGLEKSLIKVRTGSEMMDWIKKNATIVNMETMCQDHNYTCITTLWTSQTKAKFHSQFVRNKG